jgi:hypothetical protein
MGDVLFAPLTRRSLSAAERARLKPLLGILDPALIDASAR